MTTTNLIQHSFKQENSALAEINFCTITTRRIAKHLCSDAARIKTVETRILNFQKAITTITRGRGADFLTPQDCQIREQVLYWSQEGAAKIIAVLRFVEIFPMTCEGFCYHFLPNRDEKMNTELLKTAYLYKAEKEALVWHCLLGEKNPYFLILKTWNLSSDKDWLKAYGKIVNILRDYEGRIDLPSDSFSEIISPRIFLKSSVDDRETISLLKESEQELQSQCDLLSDNLGSVRLELMSTQQKLQTLRQQITAIKKKRVIPTILAKSLV